MPVLFLPLFAGTLALQQPAPADPHAERTPRDSGPSEVAAERSPRESVQDPVEASIAPIFPFDQWDAPGVAADVALAVSEHWALRVAAFGTQMREETPDFGGSLLWSRPALTLGPRLRVALHSLFRVDLNAHALVGVLLVEGEDYPENDKSWGFDLGLGAEIRPTFHLGRALEADGRTPLSLWLGLGANYWVSTHTFIVDVPGDTRRGEVSDFDLLLLGLGITWGFGS